MRETDRGRRRRSYVRDTYHPHGTFLAAVLERDTAGIAAAQVKDGSSVMEEHTDD